MKQVDKFQDLDLMAKLYNLSFFLTFLGIFMRRSLIILVLALSYWISSTQAQTTVGGIISKNTRWSLESSPYIVNDSIWVVSGVTLTIEPGVKVLFEDKDIILVDGELIARGEIQNRIIFSTASPIPLPGSWQGIIFSPTSIDAVVDQNGNYLSGSIIYQAEISYGGLIQAESSSPYISDNYIHHINGASLRDWPRGAIWACNSHLVVKGNLIEQNEVSGLVLLGSRALVENNTIVSNMGGEGWGGGVLLANSSCELEPETSNSSIIRSNFIGYNQASNTGGGIAIYSGDHLIEGNCILGNQTPNVSITNTGGAAIGSFSNQSVIINNNISSNVGAQAIYIQLPSASSQHFNSNNITNPSSQKELVVKSDGTSAIDITSNFWGNEDTENISKRVQTQYGDSISNVLLSNEAILPAPIDVPACTLQPASPIILEQPVYRKPKRYKTPKKLIKRARLSTKTIQPLGGLVLVYADLLPSQNPSVWVTVTSSESGTVEPAITEGMQCAEQKCVGILKFRIPEGGNSGGEASARKLKSKKVYVTVYASLNGRVWKQRAGILRLG